MRYIAIAMEKKRKRLNLTFEKAAAELGVNIGTFHRAVNGREMSLDVFERACEWVNISPSKGIKKVRGK